MRLTKCMKTPLTKATSLLLAATMTAGLGLASVSADETANTTVIDQSTVWYYTDLGEDPAGNSAEAGYDSTVWAKAGYDYSNWKSATGSFGAKKGAIADLGSGYIPNTLLTQYEEDGTTDIPSYFFRTNVNVEDPSAITKIEGTVIYDDSATIYINGVKIAGFDDSDISGNLGYGGSNDGTPRTGSISVTEGIQDILVQGENVVAVEIHQGRANSSDIYFDMPSLSFSTDPVDQGTDEEEEEDIEIGSISLSIGSNETQKNFTWYANANTDAALLVAKTSELVDGAMPQTAMSFSADVKEATNKSGYYSYQTTASNLEIGNTYAYQIVVGNSSSEIGTFTTGSGSSFSFAFAGDPQIGASGSTTSDTDGWENTLNLINSNAELSGVDFMLSAGDQVNRANDEDQYDGYLEHSTLQDLPVATVVGNHDSSSVAYDEHFNVPNESAYGSTAASGDYYFVYNNVLFMALNSNNRSTAEHKAFMEEAIAATADQNITWKIVTFHHSIYSVANHASESDILERREQLAPIFKDLDIDVVLMGHDHVYCRTYMMDGLTPMTDASIYDDNNYSSITNPEGILYVTANSASGSKFYTIQTNQEFPYSYIMNQERVPNISRVDVSDGQFTITTYRTSDMSVVDTFTIYHKDAYNVTLDESEHGTVTSDADTAYEGDTVTLTATPEDGYKFAGWNVVSGNVTISEDNTFVMPAGDVEIQAVFEHIHTYSDEWTTDESKHYHECTLNDGAVSDEAEHTMSWVVDKEATATEEGSKHEECSVCGYTRNENTVIPATGTDKKSDSDKSNNNQSSANKNQSTSNKNQSTSGSGSSSASQLKGTNTGDTNSMTMWIVLTVICAAAAAGVIVIRKKKND